MQIYISYIHILCIVWLFVIYYGERIYPKLTITSCQWPRDPSWPSDAIPARIALVADPQIIDAHTYPGRNFIFQRITESIVDYYLRRNWVYIHSQIDPDANIFLGDLFDGGREWSDDVWKKEYDRWNRIFVKPPYKRTIMSLPGNHDIGYGNTIVYEALQRFSMFFGEPSSTVEIGNHTIVLLDTISMMNTENTTIYDRPYNFLNELIQRPNFFEDKPRILLTHVPLFRDADHPCGKNRESKKPLPYIKGYQYQTMVTPEVSQIILGAVRPEAVFSGDDHDACYVLHNYTIAQTSHDETEDLPPLLKSTAEYTAKSASMAMGIGHPGIQLLSLYNPTAGKEIEGSSKQRMPTFATSICYMPIPFKSFIIYIVLAFLTSTLIVAFNFIPDIFPPIVYMVLSQKRPLYSSVGNDEESSSFRDKSSLPMHKSDLESLTSSSRARSSSASFSISPYHPAGEKSSAPRHTKHVKFASVDYMLGPDEDNEKDDRYQHGTSPYAKGSSQSIKSTLQRARFKMGNKKLWKKAAKEFALIGVPAFVFYIYLLYSIYRAPPSFS